MFTGIVEEIGRVRSVEVHDGHARLVIDAAVVLDGTPVGGSIAVDGCCLTATDLTEHGFASDLMAETLRATSLGGLGVGDPVNLERPMAADGRFGGHLVQGHVDGVATVTGREELPGTVFLTFQAPPEVAPYLVPKGSVTIAGTSLTVVDITDDDRFRVGLIPHTLAATTLGVRRVGDPVNLEVDVIAKYVERLVRGGFATPYDVAGRDAS